MTNVAASYLSAGLSSAQSVYNARNQSQGIVQFAQVDSAGKRHVAVAFELSTQETYGQDTQVTSNPIEDGSVVSDHVIVSPFTLELTCLITDTPLHAGPDGLKSLATEGAVSVIGAAAGPLGIVASAGAYAGITGSTLYTANAASKSRSTQNYNVLKKMQTVNPTPFIVTTKLGEFKDMLITKLSAPRSADTGDALMFNVSLMQVTIVKSQTSGVALTNASNPALATNKAKLGELGENINGFDPGAKAGAAAEQSATASIKNLVSKLPGF